MTPRSPLEELAEIEREMHRPVADCATVGDDTIVMGVNVMARWAARLAAARGAIEALCPHGELAARHGTSEDGRYNLHRCTLCGMEKRVLII